MGKSDHITSSSREPSKRVLEHSPPPVSAIPLSSSREPSKRVLEHSPPSVSQAQRRRNTTVGKAQKRRRTPEGECLKSLIINCFRHTLRECRIKLSEFPRVASRLRCARETYTGLGSITLFKGYLRSNSLRSTPLQRIILWNS